MLESKLMKITAQWNKRANSTLNNSKEQFICIWILGFWEKTSLVTVTVKATAPHSSTLAWRIPWTEEPGGLQSMGSLGVEHDWATSLSLFTFMHWRRRRQPTPVFLPGESQGRGSLVGCRLWSCTEWHDRSDLAAAAARTPGIGMTCGVSCVMGWNLSEGKGNPRELLFLLN